MAGKWQRSDGGWHFDIRSTAKNEMEAFLQAEVTPDDCANWIKLLELIHERLAI